MAGVKKDVTRLKNASSVWAVRRDIPLAILGWLSLTIIIFWLLEHISRSLLLFAIAAILAYALVPAVQFFQRFIPKVFAILVVYCVVLIGLGVLFYIVISTAIQQFTMLAQNTQILLTPTGDNTSSPLVKTLNSFGISQEQLALIGDQLTRYAESLTESIIPFLTGVFSSILDTLLVAVLSIYVLLDGERVVKWLRSSLPTSEKKKIEFLLHTLQRVVGGYIRGQLLLAVIVGFLVGIGMAIFQVPYPVLLGVLAFICAFIPFLGTFISGAICILLALTKGWVIAVIVLIYFTIVHIIEGDILGPRIVGRALGLHPVVSILALIAGTELYGIAGALFAAPIAGLAQAVLVTLWAEWKETHPKSFARTKRKLARKV